MLKTVRLQKNSSLMLEFRRCIVYFGLELFSYTNKRTAVVNFVSKGTIHISLPRESRIKYITLQYHMCKIITNDGALQYCTEMVFS